MEINLTPRVANQSITNLLHNLHFLDCLRSRNKRLLHVLHYRLILIYPHGNTIKRQFDRFPR